MKVYYYVVRHRHGWAIEQDRRTIGRHSLQSMAEDAALELAARDFEAGRVAEVRIQDEQGRWRERHPSEVSPGAH